MCDHCQAVMINGVHCHEIGCPIAPRKCSTCGEYFEPELGQRICDDCHEEALAIIEDVYNGDLDNNEFLDEEDDDAAD